MNIILDLCDNSLKTKAFRQTINKHHSYMDYKDTCNRRINWNVFEVESGNLIGAVGINSAILAMSCRDSFIGWDKSLRLDNLNKIANNYRFALISENITIKNAGTQILKELRNKSKIEWYNRYGDILVLLETLVKPPWTGAIYKADNWSYLGMTKGVSFSKAPLLAWQKEKSKRGELARLNPQKAIEMYAVGNKKYNITKSEPKLIFVKSLCNDWKNILNTPLEKFNLTNNEIGDSIKYMI